MSSPSEYYNPLPPISKAFGTTCLIATTAFLLGLNNSEHFALVYQLVFYCFQVMIRYYNPLPPISKAFGTACLIATTAFLLLRYYNSLPPISKAFGTACVIATTAFHLELYNPAHFALVYQLVFYRFQVWRLFTNFFFLGKFSVNFGIRLFLIARYEVQLEKGPFERRTADFLWMMIFGALSLLVLSAIPFLWTPFLGLSLVSMLLYVWSREHNRKAFYLPWAMLALDVIFGSPILPDLLGIIAGHLYYFLTVLRPLAGGNNILTTPRWVDRIVRRWRIGYPTNTPVQPQRDAATATATATGTTFRGRSYRLAD